jgi:DNA polymerase III subunit delta'
MARQVDSILGHQKSIDKLMKSLASGNLFSSAIFSGPEGIGKKRVALALAQEANCKQSPACGECAECLRFSVVPNEGYLLIEPTGDKIKIEQVRDVVEYLSLRSRLKDRFIIIDQADSLTTQAANALLKSIEEPPEGVHFILITSNVAMLLPTIRSRCQIFSFTALSKKDLTEIVPNLQAWQAQWSFGRVSLAQRIVEDEWQELRKVAINFLHRPTEKEQFEALAKEFSDGGKVDYIFHTWMTYLRDAIAVREGTTGQLYNEDIQGFVKKFSEKLNMDKSVDALFSAREDYSANVDKGLILENLALVLEA